MEQKRIEVKRQELHSLIEQNANYSAIYKASIELDLLINEYYYNNGYRVLGA